MSNGFGLSYDKRPLSNSGLKGRIGSIDCRIHSISNHSYRAFNNVLFFESWLFNVGGGNWCLFTSLRFSLVLSCLFFSISKVIFIPVFLTSLSFFMVWLVVNAFCYLWFLSFSVLLFHLVLWVNELQIESTEGRISFALQSSFILCFKVFVLSEFSLFLTLFWGFLNGLLIGSSFLSFNFPAFGIVNLSSFGFSLSNVGLLLYSTLPLHAAQHWMKRRIKSRTLAGISQTIFSGLLFLVSQLKE